MGGSVDRRHFLRSVAGGLAAAAAPGCVRRAGVPLDAPIGYTVRTLTQGPKHHFFGYYGICPWNASGTRLLGLESSFQDHMPGPADAARIGLVDGADGAFDPIAETRAWNFQQGAMLHWHPLAPNREVIYNDIEHGTLVSRVLDIETGAKRLLPRPVSGVSRSGHWAVSLTYGRLGRLRNVVGYAAAADPYPDDPHPEKDGVFVMNLETGETRLAVSIAQVYELLKDRHPELADQHLWFNHTVINRDSTRMLFLARTRNRGGGLETGMFTAGLDGSDLREVIPYGRRVSHFDWGEGQQIAATYEFGERNRQHVLFHDGDQDHRVIGNGSLDFDGHCTFSPDGAWLATDRKWSRSIENELLVYHIRTDACTSLGRFAMGDRRFISGDLRCDLHPRWSRTGNTICFDAIEPETATRQLHVATLEFPL